MTRKGIWDLQEVRDMQLQEKWDADTNTLWTWGTNSYGELGHNDRTERPNAVQVPGTNWDEPQPMCTNTGGSHTRFCRKLDGTMWAWGQNNFGQLGLNDVVNRSSPTQIPGTWANIYPGEEACYGVRTDGTFWSWGSNSRGGLGLNQSTPTKISSPTQLPGTNWAFGRGKVSAGLQCVWALKTDGSLYNWGDNEYGQLGQGNRTQYSSPRQVPGTSWNSVGGLYAMGCATRTDGTLWAWGPNESGRLGLNGPTNQDYSSPKQVLGSNWARVYASGSMVAAYDDAGKMYIWGNNNTGQMALSLPGNQSYSSPILIPGVWESESAGFPRNGSAWLALKKDGRLWGCGRQTDGQLGRFGQPVPSGEGPPISSPVQIGSGVWWMSGTVQGGHYGGMGIKRNIPNEDYKKGIDQINV